MTEREQIKIISDDPEGFCLKYRDEIVQGDRKYYPPSEEQEIKKRKVKYDPISE